VGFGNTVFIDRLASEDNEIRIMLRPGSYRCENLVYWLYKQRFLSEEKEEERKKKEIPTSAKQAISQWVLETVHHSFTVTSAYSSFTLAVPHT
jgi:hypothetical protein